jgi:hypothetical protein
MQSFPPFLTRDHAPWRYRPITIPLPRLAPKVIFLRKSQVKSPKSQSHDFDFFEKNRKVKVMTLTFLKKQEKVKVITLTFLKITKKVKIMTLTFLKKTKKVKAMTLTFFKGRLENTFRRFF